MEWAYILILLIPLLVWVLATIFRGAEDPKVPNRRPTDGAPAAPRRQASELDRFLEEAQRRRDKAAERKAETRREEMLGAQPYDQPAPPPPPPAAKPPEPRPRKETTPPRRERPAAEKKFPSYVPTPAPVPVDLPAPAAAPPRPALAGAAAAPVLARLVTMLRDRKALAAGLVLREVLDRPLCQRRGRT